MKTIPKIMSTLVLTNGLLLGDPSTDINRNEKLINSDKVERILSNNRGDKYFNDMKLIFFINDIFIKKEGKINNIFKPLMQKGNFKLHLMETDDFQKIVDIIYKEDDTILKIRNTSHFEEKNINFILQEKKISFEKKWDLLFYYMFNYAEVNKGLLYMQYVDVNYGYNNSDFIENSFDLDNYLKYYSNNKITNILSEINSISSVDDKLSIINNMDSIDILGGGIKRDKITDRELIFYDYFIDIIKQKLKLLYVKKE